jgi:hypothetical protein
MSVGNGTVAATLAVAQSQVGVQDTPFNSGDVPYWAGIGRADWNGEPWCACFVTWCMIQAGVPFPTIDTPGGFVYCPDALTWARYHGAVIPMGSQQPGDLVLFDWEMGTSADTGTADHVGIVKSSDNTTLFTIEGNSPSPDGNYGVNDQTHPLVGGDILAFVRPPYNAGPNGSPPPPGPSPVPIATPQYGGNMICEALSTESGGWSTSPNGGVYCYGGTQFYGSLPSLKVTPNKPIIGIWSSGANHDENGEGYFLVGADGGVFCFGDAKMLGSLVDHPLWHAGLSTTPCIGAAAWYGDGTLTGGLGYVLATRPLGSAQPEYYEFPGSGEYMVGVK